MRVSEKSAQEIQIDCLAWAKEIEKDFSPDLIVFVAKSGFLFAKPLAEYFRCDMVDLVASRSASKGKDFLKPVIKLIPSKLLLFLLSSPMMYRFNEKKSSRNIMVTDRYKIAKNNSYDKILIVDDSADTGWTIKTIQETIQRDFPMAMIKTACYTVIDNSKKRVKIDFRRYENAVILTATSRRSAEYSNFLDEYMLWSKGSNGEIQREQ